MATSSDPWEKLREPFDKDKIKQKRGQGNRMMNYISHGLITERLNKADPGWSSEVLTEHLYKDPNTGRLHCEGVTIALTVNGVRRVEAGGPQRQDGFSNEIKNAYSDALKRAAMRFGVALEMWESLVDSEDDEDYTAEVYQVATRVEAAPIPTASVAAVGPDQPAMMRQLRYLQAAAKEAGLDGVALDAASEREFGVKAADLSRRDCSTLIDIIQTGGGTPKPAEALITQGQMTQMGELMRGLGWHIEHRRNWAKKHGGTANVQELTQENAAHMIAMLQKELDTALVATTPSGQGGLM